MTRPRQLRVSAGLVLLLCLGGCRRVQFPQLSNNHREYAYVANSGAGTVTVLDLVNFRADRTLQVGASPVDAVAHPLRNEVYVVNRGSAGTSGSVSVINAEDNSMAATVRVERAPEAMAVDGKTERGYVANSASDSISVIDLKAHRVVATVKTDHEPWKLAVTPDGRVLVAIHRGGGSVIVYGIASGTPTVRSRYNGCDGAADVAVLPDSSKTFVACSGNGQVMAIALGSAPGSWAAKQDPASVQDHLLARLRVGASPQHLSLKPDGGQLFVSNSGSDSVTAISTYTNEVTGTYVIGTQPADGVVSADNGALWVSDQGSDSVSLYSIDEGRMSTSIHTGPGPDAVALSPDQPLLLVADSKGADVAVIRTAATNGPGLFTMLPAGAKPAAIAIKAFQAK